MAPENREGGEGSRKRRGSEARTSTPKKAREQPPSGGRAVVQGDGDVVMTDAPYGSAQPHHDPIICFGSIGRLPSRQETSSECMGLIDPNWKKSSPPDAGRDGYIGATLREELDSPLRWGLYTEHGERLATLDLATAGLLLSLRSLSIPRLRFQAIIRPTDIKKCDKKGPFPLSVNIMGLESAADRIGQKLESHKAYLQHPYSLDKGIEYLNPHFYFTGPVQYLTHLVGDTEKQVAAKMLSDEIADAMDSLAQPDLSSTLMFEDIATDLKEHQRQAVDFILRREDPEYCRKTNSLVRDITEGGRSDLDSVGKMSSATGGMIADVMGMGKTLSAITAIVASKEGARQFMASAEPGAGGRAKGPTLVVVPSVQLMNVWQTEISKHVKPGQVTVCAFHGPKRPDSATKLIALRSDIVITTYPTLAAGSRKERKVGILHQIDWYRVVLDEAHWIRNQSSKWFAAAKSLVSQRRWCITGTPVQNSLDDLGSLLNFLDIQPFAERACFKALILAPLSRKESGRVSNLRSLLASMCLRRGSRYLRLPTTREEQVDVELTLEETTQYKRILEECRKTMDDTVCRDGGTTNTTGKFNILFGAMMRVRRLCNNGSFQATDLPGAPGVLAPSLGGEEPDGLPCEHCGDFDMVSTGEEFCDQCGRHINIPVNKSFGHQSPSPLVMEERPGTQASLSSPTFMGHSSKLDMVVRKIREAPPGDKSIIFSTWTLTLDILQYLLQSKGVGFVRIDGGVQASDRAAIVQEFSSSPKIPVLLMTLGTGAVGLTITAANRVHLVEPQWNPFVEEQAIARAVRMGQMREVTVLRYVVKNSVEKNIVDLNKRKSNLAKFTIDEGEDRMSGNLKDLHFILDM